MTLFPRASGILLHPTSLPGRYGIGDLGAWAYRFIDWLHASGQSLWQVLPLAPTGYGDSPYQTLSAFAGNPMLISLDRLIEEGWLTHDDLATPPSFPTTFVDFGSVIPFHTQMLALAFDRFQKRATDAQLETFEMWCADNKAWLGDYGLFRALKDAEGGRPWTEWEDRAVALYEPEALEAARARHADAIVQHQFQQWLFARQWADVRAYAKTRSIRLVGDIPIFVAHDSADVWANQSLFYLDAEGNAEIVAGVPPDYFSITGQRWGNPLYKWNEHEATRYAWWLTRMRAALAQVDLVRIDHFRGFEQFYAIPKDSPTAERGEWMMGPQMAFFDALRGGLSDLLDDEGKLPIIAEDLGIITSEVYALRDGLDLPGMLILQFAWGGKGGESRFLPHNHRVHSIVYTGTHDNNTTLGWWKSETDNAIRSQLGAYVGHYVTDVTWDMIRLAMLSVAHTCITPLQDIFTLDGSGRMNTPGEPAGNWTWRFLPEMLTDAVGGRLAELTILSGRLPGTVIE